MRGHDGHHSSRSSVPGPNRCNVLWNFGNCTRRFTEQDTPLFGQDTPLFGQDTPLSEQDTPRCNPPIVGEAMPSVSRSGRVVVALSYGSYASQVGVLHCLDLSTGVSEWVSECVCE